MGFWDVLRGRRRSPTRGRRGERGARLEARGERRRDEPTRVLGSGEGPAPGGGRPPSPSPSAQPAPTVVHRPSPEPPSGPAPSPPSPSPPPPSPPPSTPPSSEATIYGATAAASTGRVVGVLIGVEGELEGEVFRLFDGENRLGRARDCDVVLGSQRISRAHAKVIHHDGQFVIGPLSEKNPTFVNDEPTEGTELKDGDFVRVGRTTLRFRTAF